MLRPLLLVFGLANLLTCAHSAPVASAPPAAFVGAPAVEVHGALRKMMHEGDVAPKVGLASQVPGPHRFAVGALSELRGEVTIVDDVIWLSYPSKVERLERSDETATLLASSSVAEWRSVVVEEPVPFERLDEVVERLAREQGLDTAQPFAVRIEGDFSDLRWHVVDGRRLAPGDSHEAHRQKSVWGLEARGQGTFVGFFSRNHVGVFTHVGSATHFHVVLPERRIAGHVDGVRLEPGARLMFPAVSPATALAP